MLTGCGAHVDRPSDSTCTVDANDTTLFIPKGCNDVSLTGTLGDSPSALVLNTNGPWPPLIDPRGLDPAGHALYVSWTPSPTGPAVTEDGITVHTPDGCKYTPS